MQLAVLNLRATARDGRWNKGIGAPQATPPLDIAFTDVTPSGLKDLAPLSELTWLVLGGKQATAEGLKDLAPLTKLTALIVVGTFPTFSSLTDEDPQHLAAVHTTHQSPIAPHGYQR